MTGARAILALAVAALLGGGEGCITERTVRPAPGGVLGAGSLGGTGPLSPAGGGGGKPVAFPTGPVARPALEADTFVSHVTATLLDVGKAPSDGMLLPLVSPDGRFVALQSGDAPPWPTILAEPGAEPAMGVQVRAYALPLPEAGQAAAKATPDLQPVAWPNELEPGVVLGRSCDDQGFLVEWPRDDGSRWIGKVNWVTGQTSWLAGPQDPVPMVNAHASFGPAGELAYSRRPSMAGAHAARDLVVRLPPLDRSDELVLTGRGQGFSYPLFPSGGVTADGGGAGGGGDRGDGGDAGVFFAILLGSSTGDAELSLATIRIDRRQGRLHLRGTRRLMARADAIAAYQATAAIQSPAPASSSTEPAATEQLLFHPGEGRMISFDPSLGSFVRLPEGTMAGIATAAGDVDGFLVTDRDKLGVSVRRSAREQSRPPTQAMVDVLAGPFVARAVSNAQWPYLLVGPTKVGGVGVGGFGMKFLRLRLGAAENSP